ncbi:MAG: hypothetical protein KAR54_00450 [Candidatus Pacebacteria bacterium]|nr:hypothetical protein [Candidatus Paceibacterota bacterium]
MEAITQINNLNKKRIFIFLSFSVLSLSVVYVYFITQITMNIAIYKSIAQEMVDMDSNIGKLEFEYMSLKKDINFNMAKTIGFIEASNIKFVDRRVVNDKLSLVN